MYRFEAARGSDDGEDRNHGEAFARLSSCHTPLSTKQAHGVTRCAHAPSSHPEIRAGFLRKVAPPGWRSLRFLAPALAASSGAFPKVHRDDHRRSPEPASVMLAERLRPLSGAGAGSPSGPPRPPLRRGFDPHRLDRIAGLEAEDLRVERQLRLVAPPGSSRPCGTRAARPRTGGRRTGGPSASSASTMTSACAGGTTSSSAPWSTIIGLEIRSTKWIGDRAR